MIDTKLDARITALERDVADSQAALHNAEVALAKAKEERSRLAAEMAREQAIREIDNLLNLGTFGDLSEWLLAGNNSQKLSRWAKESGVGEIEAISKLIANVYGVGGNPKFQRFMDICWDRGHSSGFYDVLLVADELIFLLD
jgi:hypothetical protein